MKEYLSKNKFSIIAIFVIFMLAGAAFGTAYQLYTISTTAPQDSSASGNNNTESCSSIFVPISTPTPTPTPTETPTSTPTSTPTATPSETPSPTPTPTVTPTSTPTATPLSYSCDTPCNTDAQCRTANSSYICYSATNTCRHINYPQQNNCEPQSTSTSSPTPTPTATPTATTSTSTPTPTSTAELPEAGIALPTVAGMIAAGALLLLSLVLAL